MIILLKMKLSSLVVIYDRAWIISAYYFLHSRRQKHSLVMPEERNQNDYGKWHADQPQQCSAT
jgi:hypothetical protein